VTEVTDRQHPQRISLAVPNLYPRKGYSAMGVIWTSAGDAEEHDGHTDAEKKAGLLVLCPTQCRDGDMLRVPVLKESQILDENELSERMA
jgi:hypothetical protein